MESMRSNRHHKPLRNLHPALLTPQKSSFFKHLQKADTLCDCNNSSASEADGSHGSYNCRLGGIPSLPRLPFSKAISHFRLHKASGGCKESLKPEACFRWKVYLASFERDWLRTDLSVIGFGLIGWIAPSSLPVINGNSLTGLFFQSISTELAHWPTGPALTSPFWLWLITWHLGLFITLTFGQIGFKGRTEEYF